MRHANMVSYRASLASGELELYWAHMTSVRVGREGGVPT